MLVPACYMLGLAATSRWEVSLVTERRSVLAVCILCKLLYCIHIYMVCALRVVKVTFQKWVE